MEKDGWRFVGPAGILAVILLVWGWTGGGLVAVVAGVLCAVAGGFLVFFFRDPQRQPPDGEGWIVSPADGRVLSVDTVHGGRRVAIFLSVFNVHVNRAPATGTVKEIDYKRGRFLKAYDPRASTENERVVVTMDSACGLIEFALIAGILARRVVCRLSEGQHVRLGERIGLIRFGSRAEVVVPSTATLLVKPGDRVAGGLTPLARYGTGNPHA
jgi:phosphatidylserine decarboxylase